MPNRPVTIRRWELLLVFIVIVLASAGGLDLLHRQGRKNCQQIELVKATFIAFIAEITYYDHKTRTVKPPPGRHLTPAQVKRTVAFNELAEKRFSPDRCP